MAPQQRDHRAEQQRRADQPERPDLLAEQQPGQRRRRERLDQRGCARTVAEVVRIPRVNNTYPSAVGTKPRYTSTAQPSGGKSSRGPSTSIAGSSTSAPTPNPTVTDSNGWHCRATERLSSATSA